MGALNALVSHFRDAEKVELDKEARQILLSLVTPLSKRLFLGHFTGRESNTGHSERLAARLKLQKRAPFSVHVLQVQALNCRHTAAVFTVGEAQRSNLFFALVRS